VRVDAINAFNVYWSWLVIDGTLKLVAYHFHGHKLAQAYLLIAEGGGQRERKNDRIRGRRRRPRLLDLEEGLTMAAVGILLIGIGAYLMYDAVKSTTPAPVTNAKTALTKVSNG
jgi:hypothetical protein